MAKAKKEKVPAGANHGIRVVGLDPNLHRALRLVAVRHGIAVRDIYHEAMRDVLVKHGEKVVA